MSYSAADDTQEYQRMKHLHATTVLLPQEIVMCNRMLLKNIVSFQFGRSADMKELSEYILTLRRIGTCFDVPHDQSP